MRMRLAVALVLAAGVGFAWPHAAAAQDSVAVAHPWFEEISVNGFVSSWYSYNFNRPPDRLNAFRVFDLDDNTFQVGVAELVAQRAVSKPGDAGFRVDVAMGSSVPRVSAASGLFRDPVTGVAQDIDLQQALASYIAPVGSGLRLGAGKFVTHCGMEVIEGYDGWNDQATRSFLFGYAIPFTHTGIRADYTFGPKVAATAMLVNGWDDARDNNAAKTGGIQLALTPSPAIGLILNGLVGAERPGNDHDVRSLLDVVLTAKASDLTFGLNGDIAQEQTPAGDHDTWSGAAGYARWQASPRFALALRGEVFDDPQGVRTGVTQTLSEGTITPELRITPRWLLRGDLRLDHSNHDVFATGTGVKDTQTTLLVNVLAAF